MIWDDDTEITRELRVDLGDIDWACDDLLISAEPPPSSELTRRCESLIRRLGGGECDGLVGRSDPEPGGVSWVSYQVSPTQAVVRVSTVTGQDSTIEVSRMFTDSSTAEDFEYFENLARVLFATAASLQ